MTIRVNLPDGSAVDFPDGTSQDVMSSAIQNHLGAPAQKPVDPGFLDRFTQRTTQQVGGPTAPPLTPNAGLGSVAADKLMNVMDYINGLNNTVNRGLTLGTSDEAGALGKTTAQSIQGPSIANVVNRVATGQPSPSFGQRFIANDQAENAAIDKFKKDNPIAGNIAEIGGLIASPVGNAGANYVQKAPNLLNKLARGGLVGAATSGGMTFTNANGDVADRFQNVPLATLTGFPIGVAGTAAAETLSKVLPSGRANQALQNATMDQSGARLQQVANMPGSPAANDIGLADLLKGAATLAPNRASQYVPGALSNLENGYARTAADIDTLISPQNSTQVVQDISNKARQAAQTGYGAAYANQAPIALPQSILDREAFKDALPIATKLAADSGRKLDVNNLTTEDLDYIQRSLKALSDTSFNAGNAAQKAMGPRYSDVQGQVLQATETANPVFQQTRQSYAQAMSRKEAVQTGLDWMKSTKSADDVATEFAAMSPGEQNAAKAGFATKLKNMLAAKPTRQSPNRTLDVTLVKQKLQGIGVPADAVQDILDREQGVKQVYDALTGGSDTARKLAIQRSLSNPLSDLRGGDVAAAALTGGGSAIGLPAVRAVGRGAEVNTADQLVQALASSDSAQLKALLARNPALYGKVGLLSGILRNPAPLTAGLLSGGRTGQ